MKNWIELTDRNAKPVFVNLDHVVLVKKFNDETHIVFVGDDSYCYVAESYNEVVLMIHHAGEDEISMSHTERVGCLEVRETIYQQSNDVPVRVAAPPDNSFVKRADCSNALRMQGNVAVPRTCKACGLGPCRYGHSTLT